MSEKCRSLNVSVAVHVNFPRRITPASPLVIKLFVPAGTLSAIDGVSILGDLISNKMVDRVTSNETNGQLAITFEYDQPVKLATTNRHRAKYAADRLLPMTLIAVVDNITKRPKP